MVTVLFHDSEDNVSTEEETQPAIYNVFEVKDAVTFYRIHDDNLGLNDYSYGKISFTDIDMGAYQAKLTAGVDYVKPSTLNDYATKNELTDSVSSVNPDRISDDDISNLFTNDNLSNDDDSDIQGYSGDGLQDLKTAFYNAHFTENNINNYSLLDLQTYFKTLPNYSLEEDGMKYKWGYIELSKNDNAEIFQEAYRRIYNAYKYGYKNNRYVFYQYESTGLTENYICTSSIYTIQQCGNSKVLYLVLSDLSIDVDEFDYIHGLVVDDNPEIAYRYGITYIDPDSLEKNSFCYMYRVNSKTNCLAYVGLSYWEDSDVKKGYMEKTFRKICNTVKKVYGIQYHINSTYETNNKLYTPKEKSQIVKVIHDYLCTHNNYGDCTDDGYFGGNQEAWSALSEGVFDPVCAGYSSAFVYCCWRFGITCVEVVGMGKPSTTWGSHAWNLLTYEPYTFLDSEIFQENIWQEIDSTWDDPVIDSNYDFTLFCNWDFFNKKTSYMSTTHSRSMHGNPSIHGDLQGTYAAYPVINGTCDKYVYDKTNNSTYTGGGLYYGM